MKSILSLLLLLHSFLPYYNCCVLYSLFVLFELSSLVIQP
ncbi:unnamed protein product, partial [Trichobilharzia regenti]